MSADHKLVKAVPLAVPTYGSVESGSGHGASPGQHYSDDDESTEDHTGLDDDDFAYISRYDSVIHLPNVFLPAAESPTRQTDRIVAIFNLWSTVIGGGTLSLPYAFFKSGFALGIVTTFVSAFLSTISLKMLCLLSRKLGTARYAEVMERAIGPGMESVTNFLLIFLLLFVVIAFMVLLKDIAADILIYVLTTSHYQPTGAHATIPSFVASIKFPVLLVLVALCYPLMIAKNLYALRNVSFFGTASVLLLLVDIATKALILNTEHPHLIEERARLGPVEPTDYLTALPIILIAFLCQFNVLGIYSNLQQPAVHSTHIDQVIDVSMHGSGFIYILFGLAGYFFAFDGTRDNILNNFSPHDPALIIARVGLLLTLLCQIPMVVVPCRDAIIEFNSKYLGTTTGGVGSRWASGGATVSLRDRDYTSTGLTDDDEADEENDYDEAAADERSKINGGANGGLTKAVPIVYPSSRSQEDINAAAYSTKRYKPRYRRVGFNSGARMWGFIVHCATATIPVTLVMTAGCLYFCECVPGVSTIWTLAGSSISVILAFLLPSVGYLALWAKLGRGRTVFDWYFFWAVILVIMSCFMIVLCTLQSVKKITAPAAASV